MACFAVLAAAPATAAAQQTALGAGVSSRYATGEVMAAAGNLGGRELTDLTMQSNVNVRIDENGLQQGAIAVAPGTTVVWINTGSEPVVLHFTNKAVSITCKAPRRFSITEKGIYQSEVLARGEIASLCFLEPNDYQYEVEYLTVDGQRSTGDTVAGEITVAR